MKTISVEERASKIKDTSNLLAYDLETVVEYMRQRPTEKNVIRIKEEMIALKQLHDNGKNSLISNS